MSAVLGEPYTYRFIDSTLDPGAGYDHVARCAVKVSGTRFVLGRVVDGEFRLACLDSDGDLIGTYTWSSYISGQVFEECDFVLLPIASGTFAVVVRQYNLNVSGGTLTARTRVVIVTWTGAAPTLGTPYDLTNASPANAYDWYAYASSSGHILINRLHYTAGVADAEDYLTLQVSGTTVSAGGTAPVATLRRSGWGAVNLGGGYWVDGTEVTGGGVKIQLVQITGATVTVHSEAAITGSTADWYWDSGGASGLVAVNASTLATTVVIPSRSGTTPTYTSFAAAVRMGHGDGTALIDGYQVGVAGETASVADGGDPPTYTDEAGDARLYVGSVAVSSTARLTFDSTRTRRGWSTVQLTADLIILAWAERAQDGTDSLIQIQPVIPAVDTTGVDDVTSVLTNYLGGDILQRYFIDQPSYLALLTADPTALGSTASEVVGGDYERLPCVWSVPGTKTIGLGALRFINMPACTVSWLAVMDAAVGGHMLTAKALPAPIPVVDSAEFRVGANAIVLTL